GCPQTNTGLTPWTTRSRWPPPAPDSATDEPGDEEHQIGRRGAPHPRGARGRGGALPHGRHPPTRRGGAPPQVSRPLAAQGKGRSRRNATADRDAGDRGGE